MWPCTYVSAGLVFDIQAYNQKEFGAGKVCVYMCVGRGESNRGSSSGVVCLFNFTFALTLGHTQKPNNFLTHKYSQMTLWYTQILKRLSDTHTLKWMQLLANQFLDLYEKVNKGEKIAVTDNLGAMLNEMP